MAKSLETALPASLVIGACAVLCAVFLFCCAKRKSSPQTLHSVTFESRPHAVTGVAKDTVVLQFMDNTGAYRNNIIIDTASLSMSQQNRTTRAPAFRHNIAGLGQPRREMHCGNQIPQLKMPTHIPTANSRQRGRTVEDKVSLVEDYEETLQKSLSSSGYQSRRDFLALTRGLPEASTSQKTLAVVKPQRPSAGEGFRRFYSEAEGSADTLSGPFGPYDCIKSNNLQGKGEPFYHILEEQTTGKSMSCPTGRSKEPFVHIFPSQTAMAATYSEGEDSAVSSRGPFGPYDSIKSNNRQEKGEPLYHILEEQPTAKSMSCPTGRSKEPFVHIFPRKTTMAATFNESRSPHERLPLKSPGDNADNNVITHSKNSLSARIRVDYEDVDDESISKPGASEMDCRKASVVARSLNTAPAPSTQDLPNAVRSASPHLCSFDRYESPDGRHLGTDVNGVAESVAARFKPWPGCPEKVLLLYGTKYSTVVEKGESGTQDLTKSAPDKLYSNVKKVKQNANYRPVVKVPCGGTSELDVYTNDLGSQHARKSPASGTPVSGVQAPVHEAQGSDLSSRKQITLNNSSYYDHIWKHSAQTSESPGGGIYSRCRPEKDRAPEADLDQDGGKEAVKENSSSEAMIFYDRLERPNFKETSHQKSAEMLYTYQHLD